MTPPAHSRPRPLIQFRNHFLQTVGLLGQVISPSQGLYLNTGQHKHKIKAYTHQTPMPWVGFEPTIPASERAKTVHALDRAATVTGGVCKCCPISILWVIFQISENLKLKEICSRLCIVCSFALLIIWYNCMCIYQVRFHWVLCQIYILLKYTSLCLLLF
jgi:hypothetical protein